MPGWKRRNRTASVLWCLFAGVTAQAGEAPPGGASTDRQVLPAEFLEFLGEWEDRQGNWQDPMEFDDPKWQSLDVKAERQHDTN